MATPLPLINTSETATSRRPVAFSSGELERLSSLLVGPVGPPFSGMETATAGLHGALRHLGPVSPIDTSFSSSNADRGRVSVQKVTLLIRIIRDLRKREADFAHVPLSQNVPGLIRDVCVISAIQQPTIAYLHGGAYATILAERGLRASLLRLALSRVDAVACLYEAQRADLHEAGIGGPMGVVGNALCGSWITERFSRVQHNPFRVLFLGSLSRAKGFDVLCGAVDGIPELSVTAVGHWNPRDRNLKMGNLPMDFEIPANVSVNAPIDRSAILGQLTYHDALVLPSHSEGLPMVVLEAMSAGLPILASRAGGLRELGESGYINTLPTVDSQQVRQGLLDMRSSYDTALARAESARQFVSSRYSERAIAQRVLRLVQQVGVN